MLVALKSGKARMINLSEPTDWQGLRLAEAQDVSILTFIHRNVSTGVTMGRGTSLALLHVAMNLRYPI